MKNTKKEILKRIKENKSILKLFEEEYAKKLKEFENVQLQYKSKIIELTTLINSDEKLLENEQD